MRKPKITIISTFAKDEIYFKTSGETKIAEGGPAFWLLKAFREMGLEPSMLTSKRKALTRVVVLKNGETGKIVRLDRIKIGGEVLKSDCFVVSTIGNEFDLKDIRLLSGMVALDLQGYIRVSRKGLVLSENILKRINVMKLTGSEAKMVSPTILRDQKKRVLIITKGSRGVEVFQNGKREEVKSRKLNPKDTIGAGDVFLASFVVKFLENEDAFRSARFANTFAGKFLKLKNE